MADVNVVVIGPMSSGCRMLVRVLNESSHISAYLDTSHGTAPLSADIPDDVVPIVIIRKMWAAEASRQAVGGDISFLDSLTQIDRHYPDTLWIPYEGLCESTEFWIKEIAEYLDVDPWVVKESLVNQNEKWNFGGGPQVAYG